MFSPRTEVGRVWSELADRDPSLLEHFERFLSGVAAELKQSQHDKEKLQTHMKRSASHTHTHTHTHTYICTGMAVFCC